MYFLDGMLVHCRVTPSVEFAGTKRLSLHQESGPCSKALMYFLDGMLVHCRVTPSVEFAGTELYTWLDRVTERVKCLAQKHFTMTLVPALGPRSLDSGSTTLTTG